MSALEKPRDPAEVIGTRLIGARVSCVERVGGGRNSRVWRLVAEGASYALKNYPADDSRDRLGAERTALRLMEAMGIDCVPRFIAADDAERFALISWLPGGPVGQVGVGDAHAALDLLRRLHAGREHATLGRNRFASEACLSGSEVERQILARVERLRAVGDAPELAAFLDRIFRPALVRSLDTAFSRATAAGIPFEATLPWEHWTLAPSDFGFHNALRSETGGLAFLDFEYFGWDDPAKLIADFLLHPGTPVSDEVRMEIHAGALDVYGEDSGFAARLGAYYPLFALRWALILCNEFLPEAQARRRLAGVPIEPARQLAKAEAMVAIALKGLT